MIFKKIYEKYKEMGVIYAFGFADGRQDVISWVDNNRIKDNES